MKPDLNHRSYADVSGIRIENETLSPPDDTYSDCLKLSNADAVQVIGCRIYGGREDCIDMNRDCRGVVIENCDLIPGGKYAVTIKGGSNFVTIRNVVIHGHGSETDIDLGNWSDQSNGLTWYVTLDNVTMVDGSPVRCRVLWGKAPMVMGGNVKVTVVPRVLVWAWRVLRRLNIVK